MTTIVFVVSHLGAVHGGINVFNAEMISVLRSYDDLRTVCLVPSTQCVDNSFSHLTHVLALRSTGEKFLSPVDDAILATKLLKELGQIDAVIGHDVVTGDLALAIADQVGAKKILIHHMAYGRYIALMRDPEAAKAKEKHQQRLFPKADRCFAVGPLLLDNLQDIRRLSQGMAPPKLLLPPLLETSPATAPRSVPRILYSGRIEDGNDAVKQGTLAARAIGRALRNLAENVRDASVDIYGFDPDSTLIEEFRELLESEAGYRVPVKCLQFTDSRAEMLDVVKDASLLVMPSVHEGFGLVAWEAMCCGVPLVVSKNSGFYRFVESLGQAMFVDAVSVLDHNTEDAVNQQVDELANRIRSRIEYPVDAHQRAQKLLAAVRAQGGVKDTLDEFVIQCGYLLNNPSGQLESKSSDSKAASPLAVDLIIEVDVGLNKQERVEYRCATSTRRIQSALLALRSGVAGAGVTVKSSYLDRLFEIASSDPDADTRADAAVRFRADQPKIEKLKKFLNEALLALASPEFADIDFPTDHDRASAFVQLIDTLNPHMSVEGKTYIDAVRFDPYKTFSIWIPTEILESKDFFEPLFTINDGATLGDLWFDCCSDIAAAYLRACLAKSIEDAAPPPPLGHLLEWRIGSH
jgi:glycosyltransferase involved in cell wall biosynthesis